MADNSRSFPRDAVILDQILRQMGVKEYNPRVLAQLLEFTHRYVYEILTDAQDYRDYAGRKEIDMEDIRMATQTRDSYMLTDPLPRELLLSMARHCNSIPLPQIPERFGVRLPEEKYCLTAANYDVVPDPKNLPKDRSQDS